MVAAFIYILYVFVTSASGRGDRPLGEQRERVAPPPSSPAPVVASSPFERSVTPAPSPTPSPLRKPLVVTDKAKALAMAEARFKAGREKYQASLVVPDMNDAQERETALKNLDDAEPLLLEARDLLEYADQADGGVQLEKKYVADLLSDCRRRRMDLTTVRPLKDDPGSK